MPGSLTHSVAHVLSQLFIDAGIGSDFSTNGDWPTFYSHQPDAKVPDSIITIFNTVGRGHGRSQVDGETQEHEGIQVRIRSSTEEAGYTKANEIKQYIDLGVYQETTTIDGTNYLVHAITRTSGVITLGREAPNSSRRAFVINALVVVRMRN